MQVPLGHIVLSMDHPVAIPRQEYTLALALRLWLDDEGLSSLTIELLFETLGIAG